MGTSEHRVALLHHVEEISSRYHDCELLLGEMVDAIINLMSERVDEAHVTSAVGDFCAGLSELTMVHGALPSPFFRLLFRLLENPVFLSHPGGLELFTQVAVLWPSLDEQQRSALFLLAGKVIERAPLFEKCFSATFFLVYHQESSACLGQVETLLCSATQPGRRTLPYALMVLSQEAERRSWMRKRALRLLRSLRQDHDDGTAREAAVLSVLERRQRKTKRTRNADAPQTSDADASDFGDFGLKHE